MELQSGQTITTTTAAASSHGWRIIRNIFYTFFLSFMISCNAQLEQEQ
jgi:hypothetical protein